MVAGSSGPSPGRGAAPRALAGLAAVAPATRAAGGGITDHLVAIFVVALVVGVVLAVLGIVGLLLTREGRRGGGHR